MAPPASDKKKENEGEPKKGRSPVERIIVWAVILGLAGVVGAQYWQKRAYQKDHDVITAALARSTAEKPVKINEVLGQLSKEPLITDTSYGGAPAKLYTWKWGGLKEYKIDLIVSKETGNLLLIKLPGE
jgi:hypothetical protein